LVLFLLKMPWKWYFGSRGATVLDARAECLDWVNGFAYEMGPVGGNSGVGRVSDDEALKEIVVGRDKTHRARTIFCSW